MAGANVLGGTDLLGGGGIDFHALEIDGVAVGQDDLVIVKSGSDGGHLYLDGFGGALGRGGLSVKGPRGLGGAIDEVDAVAVASAGGDVELIEVEQHLDVRGIGAEADARAGIVPAVAFAGDVEHAVKARDLGGGQEILLHVRHELHVHVAGVADAGIICCDETRRGCLRLRSQWRAEEAEGSEEAGAAKEMAQGEAGAAAAWLGRGRLGGDHGVRQTGLRGWNVNFPWKDCVGLRW